MPRSVRRSVYAPGMSIRAQLTRVKRRPLATPTGHSFHVCRPSPCGCPYSSPPPGRCETTDRVPAPHTRPQCSARIPSAPHTSAEAPPWLVRDGYHLAAARSFPGQCRPAGCQQHRGRVAEDHRVFGVVLADRRTPGVVRRLCARCCTCLVPDHAHAALTFFAAALTTFTLGGVGLPLSLVPSTLDIF